MIPRLESLDPSLAFYAAVAAVAVLGYLMSRFRHGRDGFTVMDALILTMVMAIIGAAGVPMFESFSDRAKASALLQNLQTLRAQIELYRLDHNGEAPVTFEGGFPQLVRATDAAGMPGPAGTKYPFGPYLRAGIPVNPYTGRSIVTAVDKFPPAKATGGGGWLYHQQTGQIAADQEGYLKQ